MCAGMSDSFATPQMVAHQAPLSMGFPRQENWSGLPFPSPGYLPDPGSEPRSPALPELASGFFYHLERPLCSRPDTISQLISWSRVTGFWPRKVIRVIFAACRPGLLKTHTRPHPTTTPNPQLFTPLMSLEVPVEDAKPLELGYIIPRGSMIEFAMWELHIFRWKNFYLYFYRTSKLRFNIIFNCKERQQIPVVFPIPVTRPPIYFSIWC